MLLSSWGIAFRYQCWPQVRKDIYRIPYIIYMTGMVVEVFLGILMIMILVCMTSKTKFLSRAKSPGVGMVAAAGLMKMSNQTPIWTAL